MIVTASLRFCFPVALLFAGLAATAQDTGNPCDPSSRSYRSDMANITVRVQLADARTGHLLQSRVRVSFLNANGNLIRERVADQGQAEFVAGPGAFRLRSSGDGIRENTTDVFELRCGEQQHFVMLQVYFEQPEETAPKPGSAPVSASELNVPDEARKAFNKGNDAMNHGKLPEARKHFENAVRIYPAYAMAYNNLGVVLMRSAQLDEGRKAFEKAITIDPHMASAYVNLGRTFFNEKDYQKAEAALLKATAADPRSAEAYSLLSTAQYMNSEWTAALDNARKVHSLGDSGFAMAHYVAGDSLRNLNRGADAIIEFEIYLKEAPEGPMNAQARRALAELRAPSATSQLR